VIYIVQNIVDLCFRICQLPIKTNIIIIIIIIIVIIIIIIINIYLDKTKPNTDAKAM